MSSLDLGSVLNADWLPVLGPIIEGSPGAEKFLGTDRAKGMFPVRELTFRALEANPPAAWNVVIFGQNPYPRIESATGIACFDGKFKSWENALSPTLRNIIKNALIWKYGIKKDAKIGELRALLKKNKVVQPPEWFEFTLLAGCLWLNTALTTGGDLANREHEKFWMPIAMRIVEAILEAKAKDGSGVVFVLWGTVSHKLRKNIEKMNGRHNVPVRFVQTFNPAAQGDVFHDVNSFAMINSALKELGQDEVDWVPCEGWDADGLASKKASKGKKGKKRKADDDDDDDEPAKKSMKKAERDRIKGFMSETIELHALYMRIASVSDEKGADLPDISGVMEAPLMSIEDAIKHIGPDVKDVVSLLPRAQKFVEAKKLKKGPKTPTKDEIAAVYLYTTESNLYKKLNATLRAANRKRVEPYFPYLRLFFSAHDKMMKSEMELWRGVKLDLRKQYQKGATITWWGVSSCTGSMDVLTGNPMFLGTTGKRTLFQIQCKNAVSIKDYSAYNEDEYLLLPGTKLEVEDVTVDGTLYRITLVEKDEGRQVY